MADNASPIASVIVLAHNDKRYLDGCLSSLIDQDMPREEYEIIYADNASIDGSADFVGHRFPSVRVLRFDRNYGFAEGNNRAAATARGRYIAFQNADTVAHRRWLPELIKAMQSDPQIKGCHPAGLPLNPGGYNERETPITRGVMCELTPFGYVGFTEMNLDAKTIPTLFIAGGSMLIDGELESELGYFFDPTYFIYCEDTDLGLRINNLGYKVVFVPSAVGYHERGPSRRLVPNRRGLRMAYLVTRNRFITFYKNMYSWEFVLALPLLCMGSIVKVHTLSLGLATKMLYALGLIPYTVFALFIAVSGFPRYANQRRHILSNRPQGRLWLLKELWKRRRPHHVSPRGDLPEANT
jgi:GT2 family glycosyltransferase